MTTSSSCKHFNEEVRDHVCHTLVVLALYGAGNTWGLGKIAAKTEAVKRYPFLR